MIAAAMLWNVALGTVDRTVIHAYRMDLPPLPLGHLQTALHAYLLPDAAGSAIAIPTAPRSPILESVTLQYGLSLQMTTTAPSQQVLTLEMPDGLSLQKLMAESLFWEITDVVLATMAATFAVLNDGQSRPPAPPCSPREWLAVARQYLGLIGRKAEMPADGLQPAIYKELPRSALAVTLR